MYWTYFYRGLLIILFIAIASAGFAQPGDPETDPDVPISGIEILLTLGALFGVKKIYDKRKK